MVKYGGVTEGVAQDERVNPRGFMSALSKFLSQESTQRGTEEMDLKTHEKPKEKHHEDKMSNQISRNLSTESVVNGNTCRRTRETKSRILSYYYFSVQPEQGAT